MASLAHASPQSHRPTGAPDAGRAPHRSARAAESRQGVPLFLQRKATDSVSGLPTVNAPNDAYEQEADRMAGIVIQRKCTACEEADERKPVGTATVPNPEERVQTKRAFPEIPLAVQPEEKRGGPAQSAKSQATPGVPGAAQAGAEVGGAHGAAKGGEPGAAGVVQLPDLGPDIRKPDEEPPIQTKAESPGGAAVTPSIATALQGSKGGGRTLEAPVQREMEQSFGRDFSHVRVHTDGTAPDMNRALHARAFTHQGDIYFNAGEYQPDSEGGKRLLAHELTHTVQQGAAGNAIQRFTAPEPDVTVQPRPVVPDDGAEVTGRMNQKIADDPDVQNADDLSDEDREAARHPDRTKVRTESKAIQSTGENKPKVDRPAAAQDQTADQQAQINQRVDAHAPEGPATQRGRGDRGKLSPADLAAQRAEASERAAASVEIPQEPQPFQQPRIEEPLDSAGQPLPRNAGMDTRVRGLGYIGEMLREHGYEMKRHAAEQEIGSHGLDAVLHREREELANARTGASMMASHNESRREIASQSRDAHAESVQRQEFVAAHAPDLAGKADEGRKDSSDLAGEARAKANRAQNEVPDDEDSKADAEEQNGQMSSTAEGAESMDQAIVQTGARARQYERDAAHAAEQNQQSEAQITATDELITATDARIGEIQAANEASQAQIDNVATGPARIRAFARRTAQSGDELIGATIVIEGELISIQETYLSDMAAIESREAAQQRLEREQKEGSEAQLTPDQRNLVELAGMNDDEQRARISELGTDERQRLITALDGMMAATDEAPPETSAPAAGESSSMTASASEALMGKQPPDPRAPEIQEVDNHRSERVGGVLDVADENMNFLTMEQQEMLANRLVAKSITDDVKGISVLHMGKEMLQGMIDPRLSLVGVVGGFEKMVNGFAEIGNWEAWQRDPVGHLLKVAADITTGLATIFASILGIAAVIIAAMVALTIISFGFASPITGPVIAWMGTVMTYAGWGALITGGLAVYFNYLSYIKNLHDASTADTARDLFKDVDAMKQNTTDGFQGAMAVAAGVGAVKMGPKLSSGEFFERMPKTPGAWARQTVQAAREGLEKIASAPGRLGRGIRNLLRGGREGLLEFRDRIRGFFTHEPVTEPPIETPQARARTEANLNEAQGRNLSDLDEAPRNAELQNTRKSQPRPVDPNSEFHQNYDVEVESNGHTYRRRRDGNGWCRFTAKECGIPDSKLPPDVSEQAGRLAPVRRTHVLDRKARGMLRDIEKDLEARGLHWEPGDLGGSKDVDAFLAKFDDPYEGIAELNNLADRKIRLKSSRAELEGRAPGAMEKEAAGEYFGETDRPGGMTRGSAKSRETAFENKLKGDVAEARQQGQIAGPGGVREARQIFSRRTYSEMLDDLQNGRMTMREFADRFPPEGAKQVELRVPEDPFNPRSRATSRYVDHMYVENDRVVLHETKDVKKLNLDSPTHLRDQIDRDVWLAHHHEGVVIEWHFEQPLTKEVEATFKLLIKENKGRFRVVTPKGLLK